MLAVGCGPEGQPPVEADPVEEFREALPKTAVLKLELPGLGGAQTSDSKTDLGYGLREGALVGHRSEYYDFARNTVIGVNLSLAAILAPVVWTVNNVEPVMTEENKATWYAPGGAKDPNEYVLVVTRDETHFEYVLVSRPKGEQTADWAPLIYGEYTPSGQRNRGRGRVALNMNNDQSPNSHGHLIAIWNNVHDLELTVYMHEATMNDQKSAPASSAYHFVHREDGTGKFIFAKQGIDIHEGKDGLNKLEDAAVVARWDEEGNGRADLYATKGDVESAGYQYAVVTQCWKRQGFITGFEAVHVVKQGEDATLLSVDGEFAVCPFEEPGNPHIPALAAAPPDPDVPTEARE